MRKTKREEDLEAFMERLRLASAECSGAGLEEEEESQVEQTSAAIKKDFCGKCHMSFGSAEKRVAVDRTTVMHEDCYEKHLRDLQQRAARITTFGRIH